MKIGVISDLHVVHKTNHAEKAFSRLTDSDLILMVGDLADRADEKQYGTLLRLIGERLPDIPVYCVSGNHDNPARDDTCYRQFEKKLNAEYSCIVDACGAFYRRLHTYVDLIGLNPSYHQKQFFFTDKGRQLTFLRERLTESPCRYHIVMCHPPLIAHNPQRTTETAPYIAPEQDARLQAILDENRGVIFLSGHTHLVPTVEWDPTRCNLYINDGSICPTTEKDDSDKIRQGNVTLLDISESEIAVTAKGIYNEKIFLKSHITTNENDSTYTVDAIPSE